MMKSEPETFSIDDLRARPGGAEPWDGVRNYQARNMMRDEMKKGDLAFFYHSNCASPGIVGVMEVSGEARPDPTAFDPQDPHYDPKSDPEKPRWILVDVTYRRHLTRPIPLAELRRHPRLKNMRLLQKGNRLSITPVTKREWDYILGLEKKGRK